jgi:hypothetical protein
MYTLKMYIVHTSPTQKRYPTRYGSGVDPKSTKTASLGLSVNPRRIFFVFGRIALVFRRISSRPGTGRLVTNTEKRNRSLSIPDWWLDFSRPAVRFFRCCRAKFISNCDEYSVTCYPHGLQACVELVQCNQIADCFFCCCFFVTADVVVL